MLNLINSNNYTFTNNFVIQLAPSGAGICRCLPGWNHAAGGNTIDGCPVRISDDTKSAPAPRPRPQSRPRPVGFSRPTSVRRYEFETPLKSV